MGQRGIVVKSDMTTDAAFFTNEYNGLSSFVDKFFPQEQDCAVPTEEERSSPHHSQTGARKVKEYVKSLFTA